MTTAAPAMGGGSVGSSAAALVLLSRSTWTGIVSSNLLRVRDRFRLAVRGLAGTLPRIPQSGCAVVHKLHIALRAARRPRFGRGKAGAEDKANDLCAGPGKHLLEQGERFAFECHERVGSAVCGPPDPLAQIVEGVEMRQPLLIDHSEHQIAGDQRELGPQSLFLSAKRRAELVEKRR